MANISTRNVSINRDTISTNNLVKTSKDFTSASNIYASPRLLNYVESVNIDGVDKSVFYTEVDSNLKIGDKVFIINGNYDSNSLISYNRYKGGVDGYKVLDIDRCKITLDINYTGVKPHLSDSIDKLIKVQYIRSESELNYVNKQFTSRDIFTNKFSIYQNNIIYIDNINNYGITQSGFYYRDAGITQSWINVTSDFLSNNLISFISSTYSDGRVIIISDNFTYNDKEWKEGEIYHYNNGDWVVDSDHTKSFITKSNFRRGNFKGNWNKGIYGSYDEKINWNGDESNWTNGSAINIDWKSGQVNSSYSPDKSYFAEIDQSGNPIQKDNISNNRGFGYTYFYSTDISKSTVGNGNFINCNVGLIGSTFSPSDLFYNNVENISPNKVSGGRFTSCEFDGSSIESSTLNNSRINNSYVYDSKSINSYFENVVFYKSNYSSDNIIKILAYDEWNAYLYNTPSGHKIYKFYISESDYKRMKSLDRFSVKGLKVNKSDIWDSQYNKILNFFDRGFKLDNYSDYEDIISGGFTKTNIDIMCQLSTKEENNNILTSYDIGGNNFTGTYSSNNTNLPSIDIVVSRRLANADITYNDYNYNFLGLTAYGNPLSKIGNNVDITDAYIVDSYFNSGLFEQSNWNSGDYYNKNSNIIGVLTNSDDGQYNINIVSGTQISVPISSDIGLKIGDVVYLNSIDYNDGVSVTRLPNIWKVDSTSPSLLLSEYIIGSSSTMITTLLPGGTFLTSPDGLTSSYTGTNRYNYLHKVRINNSTIKSGIIRRGFMSNSTIISDVFDNSDYQFNDKKKLKGLMIMDSIFSNNGMSIKSGLITNSYFNESSDKWYNGILWRSLWESGVFNNGVVRESNWKNGVFNNGIFFLNKTSILNISYFTNIESSYYKSGTTSNNRFTWENGIFNTGHFYESVWENGIFNNGKIYKSDWLDGIFNNGTFGDEKFKIDSNNFYSGTFNNGVVINSNFESGKTYSTGFNGINWKDGIFQSGVFKNIPSDVLSTAIWENGKFNGGEFGETAIWLNGTFNGGKFTSHYGPTYTISLTQSQYAWQGGILNGGEFGTADGITNSTWWNGEMNGGTFKGKAWKNGLLSAGDFQGGYTLSVLGGTSSANASLQVDSFSSSSYYGLWLDGYVTETKDKFITNKELTTTIKRSTNSKVTDNKNAVIKNALWMSGTFSHKSGEMNNSVWLDGTFEDGTFKNSSFNPYVKRNGSLTYTFNIDDTCIWKNGNFDGGDFHISYWESGKFIMGTAYGMLWQNGVSNYMNAYNICWEDGLWRNGNWNGSHFDFNGSVTDDFTKQIMFRIMDKCSGTSSSHIWNIFEDSNDLGFNISATASNPI